MVLKRIFSTKLRGWTYIWGHGTGVPILTKNGCIYTYIIKKPNNLMNIYVYTKKKGRVTTRHLRSNPLIGTCLKPSVSTKARPPPLFFNFISCQSILIIRIYWKKTKVKQV